MASVQQGGSDRRVDAAGEGADDAAVADLLADAGDGVGGHVAWRPGTLALADAEQEVLEDLGAQGGVMYLGVKLQAEHVAPVADGGDGGVLGEGEAGESVRQHLHPVAVAHPDLERRG